MFGIGSKERDLVAEIQPCVNGVDPDLVLKLPDLMSQQFKSFDYLVEEYDFLRRSKTNPDFKKMPGSQKSVYDRRIRALEAQMKGMRRIAKILQLGYEPIMIGDKYYLGGVDHEIGGLQFTVPIPVEIMGRYREARDTKLFDEFAVASPNRAHFKVIQSVRIDPIIIACARTIDDQRSFFDPEMDYVYKTGGFVQLPGSRARNGVSFMVAHWDLSGDIQSVGL